MKKLITITAALAVVLMVSGAMAGTHFIKIGVDNDCNTGGWAYDYSVNQTSCGTNCLRWAADDLPYTYCRMYADVYKTGTSEYYSHSWVVYTASGPWMFSPDSDGTSIYYTSNRKYWMYHDWAEPSSYYNKDFAQFQYKYYSNSPTRTRRFRSAETIE